MKDNSSISEVTVCENCGMMNDVKNIYCPKCGNILELKNPKGINSGIKINSGNKKQNDRANSIKGEIDKEFKKARIITIAILILTGIIVIPVILPDDLSHLIPFMKNLSYKDLTLILPMIFFIINLSIYHFYNYRKRKKVTGPVFVLSVIISIGVNLFYIASIAGDFNIVGNEYIYEYGAIIFHIVFILLVWIPIIAQRIMEGIFPDWYKTIQF